MNPLRPKFENDSCAAACMLTGLRRLSRLSLQAHDKLPGVARTLASRRESRPVPLKELLGKKGTDTALPEPMVTQEQVK